MKKISLSLLFLATTVITACYYTQDSNDTSSIAPGAPGAKSQWAYSGKTGIGTSYEAYSNGRYDDNGATGKISKVWFSLAQGIVTETMYGLIHEAQIKELQFYIRGDNFLDSEKDDTLSKIEYLHTDEQGRPLSLAYKIINTDREGKYEIEKHVFTDPERNTLMLKVYFRALEENITPFLYLDPHVANTGSNDTAWIKNDSWLARDGNTTLAMKTDAEIIASSVGFNGVSDGVTQLKKYQQLKELYTTTGETPGNVGITLQLPTLNNDTAHWQFVLGFGATEAESVTAATETLNDGYEKTLAHYNGEGEAIGWQDYLQSLPQLERLSATTTDDGHLLYTSAMVLKAQEDKTYAGALIASLSNPWGDTKSAEESKTGYKAVWPRDFYQVAMAMLALGDTQTPKVAFEYLHQVQVTEKTPGFSGTPGWFLQKTQVDGKLEWIAVQLDQTAMPIMLAWRLWHEGLISNSEINTWYSSMLKPAANFLATGGPVDLDWSDITIEPPFTQQERWEEQSGYSPSSTAATIAGLISAADIAKFTGDVEGEKNYLAAADRYSATLEKIMFTTNGSIKKITGDGRYYLRITQNKNPNDHGALITSNGKPIPDESLILDAGFLELVRYGVRSAKNSHITDTLPELDNQQLPDNLRVKYNFEFPGHEGSFPGWRRYGEDGYGEDIKQGAAYGAIEDQMNEHQRGRVWPFFTGERGHYELARAQENNNTSTEQLNQLRNTYVKAMELFANDGLMLPEQVWDGVGNNETYNYTKGEGTNSATPLAWTHAEYIKLLRSFSDKKVWDRYPLVEKRYRDSTEN